MPDNISERVKPLLGLGKPVVCNEDAKTGEAGVKAAEISVAAGVSWGFMAESVNHRYPFSYLGAEDDKAVYSAIKMLTSP